jgi:Fe-S cluster assembly iron-binding protein IscA
MITSEKAVEKLKEEMIRRLGNVGLGFRICQDSDEAGICRLILKLDTKKQNDETVDVQGIRLFLDPCNSAQLKNLVLDYNEDISGCFILRENNQF